MRYYEQRSPWELNPERLVSDALAASQTPGLVLQQSVRPPLPQITLFPPRFGYGEPQERVPTVRGVLDIDRTYRNRRDDISGGPQGWQAASRNVNAGMW